MIFVFDERDFGLMSSWLQHLEFKADFPGKLKKWTRYCATRLITKCQCDNETFKIIYWSE